MITHFLWFIDWSSSSIKNILITDPSSRFNQSLISMTFHVFTEQPFLNHSFAVGSISLPRSQWKCLFCTARTYCQTRSPNVFDTKIVDNYWNSILVNGITIVPVCTCWKIQLSRPLLSIGEKIKKSRYIQIN